MKKVLISLFLLLQNKKIIQRFYFCFLLICFLWITTLSFSFFIISSTISSSSSSFYSISSSTSTSHSSSTSISPSISYLFQIYKVSSFYIFSERKQFNDCSSLQSQKCFSLYNFTLNQEIQRSNFILQENLNIQKNSSSYFNSCQLNLQNTINSLLAWTNQKPINQSTSSSSTSSSSSQYQTISFQSSCSSSDRSKVLNLLSINSNRKTKINTNLNPVNQIKKKNVQNTNHFFHSTLKTLQSFQTFSNEFSLYNIHYLENHTSIAPFKTSLLIKDLSSSFINNLLHTEIHLIKQQISSILTSLIACVGLNPTLLGKCSLIPTSVLSQYMKYQTFINGNFLQIKTQFNLISRIIVSYGNSVAVAIQSANNFYDSVKGFFLLNILNLLFLVS